MQQLFTIGATCQVEGLLKTLRDEHDAPEELIQLVMKDLEYPGTLNRRQVKILVAKVKKMDKYLKGHSLLTLFNYILAVAADSDLKIDNLQQLYYHYDPEIQAAEAIECGFKLANKWAKITQ